MSIPFPETALIGRGAQADVYLFEGQAVKLFHPGAKEDAVLYEADIQQKIYNAGLSAPRVFGISQFDDQYAIFMEHVQGISLGELIDKDPSRALEYLRLAASLQARVHQTPGTGLPSQREKLRRRIQAAPRLSEDMRQRLLARLDGLAHDSVVCHGDFHPYNLIQTKDGLAIIDWVDATCGSAQADVCRTYLLYLLHGRMAAEPYLQLYCEAAQAKREAVLAWLPVLAGARLYEAGRGDDEGLLMELVQGALPLDPAKGSSTPPPPVAP